MKNKANICRICLRMDRKLSPIDTRLLEFLDQLCEHSASTLNCLYCKECEHLLRKTYNFKNKCVRAMKIFEKWKNTKKLNKPAEHLYTLLPTSLGLWQLGDPKHSACIYYEYNGECDDSITDADGLDSENYIPANIFNIIKLEIGCNTDLKNLIKTEDSYTKNTEKLTNIHEDNDIEMVELKNEEVETEALPKSKLKQNELYTKDTALYVVDVENTDMLSNDKINNEIEESHTDLLFEDNGVIFDSDESDTPLSKSISRNKTKSKIKRVVKKGKERKKLKESSVKSKQKKVKLEPLQFSKERLQIELEAKFESWGELKTDDGTVIDKEVILNCLNDKITDDRMRQLWDCIQCDKPNPVTIRTFKHLMRNFTNEAQYSRVFDIEYLNTEEKMFAELERRKSYECYVRAKIRCHICYLVFYKPKHLENHVKMHEANAGDFMCNICGLRFTSGKNLRGHVTSHSIAYKCKLCPLVTYYRDSMVNHYNMHEGRSYTCDSCGKVLKSSSAYKRHQYLSHRRGRNVCTTCGRAFVSELGVLLHKKKMHQNEAPPLEGAASVCCTECDLSFPSEEVFLKHKKTWHQEHKNLKKTKRARPNNPKPPSITCRICNASGSIGWLTLHFRTEHPTLDMNVVYADKRKHLCHICAKGFWNATSLRYHLNSHTGVRPYACEHCSKRYHSGVALNEHRLRHFPPGKECKQCGKKFKTQSNLTNHMLFHTGNRRHKCSICGKAFLHSTSLNEHIRGVHYNVRRVKRGGQGGDRGGDGAGIGGDVSD